MIIDEQQPLIEKRINHSTNEQAPLGIEPILEYQPFYHTDDRIERNEDSSRW